jgi:hypothetical protein
VRAELASAGRRLLRLLARVPPPLRWPLMWTVTVLFSALVVFVVSPARGWTLLVGAVILALWGAALRWPRSIWRSFRRPERDPAVTALAGPSDERSLRIAERSTLMTQWVMAPVLWIGFFDELQRNTLGPVTWLCALDSALLVGTAVWVSRRM